MSSKTPIAKEIAWISLVPQLFVMGIIMLIWDQVNKEEAIPNGALTYIALSISLSYSIPISHRQGISLVKKLDYKQALSKFEKSYEFFTRHKWLDNLRYLTLLNSSKIPYREIALLNIAFCYGQLGNGQLAKEYYLKTLEEFPDSGMAKAGMNLINSLIKED